MSDLIDRQKAIDAIEEYFGDLPIVVHHDMVQLIKKLPSAQPEPSQVARDIATIIENEKDMRVIASAQPDVPDTNVGDIISRQAAIDVTAYATFSVTISGKRGFQNYKEEFEKACVAIRDKYIEALKALPSAQPQRWIPCSEKMPDKFGMYWVCTKGGYQVQAELTVNMGGHVDDPLVVWALPFGYPKTEVLAWMPLIEPWKGEEDANVQRN